MLRAVLIALLVLGLGVTLWAMVSGAGPSPIPSAIGTAIVLFALVFERTRYKAILDAPPAGEGWSATGEKFIDSRSGREVTVWCEAATGKRAYVGAPATDPNG